MKKTIPKTAVLVPGAATKVFSGIIFDVFQWQQELYDGSQATFELLKRPDTLELIVIKDGQLVLIEEEQPARPKITTLPGGRADVDDSWLSAAKRELLEETGLQFDNWRLIDAVQPQPKIEWFGATFLAWGEYRQDQPQLDKGEKIAVRTQPYEDFAAEVLASTDPRHDYLIPLIKRYPTLEKLLAAPEFDGQMVDR